MNKAAGSIALLELLFGTSLAIWGPNNILKPEQNTLN